MFGGEMLSNYFPSQVTENEFLSTFQTEEFINSTCLSNQTLDKNVNLTTVENEHFYPNTIVNESLPTQPSNKDIKTQPPATYCNNLLSLNNQLLLCKSSDYCCRVNTFENQFNKEQIKDASFKNTTILYSNLKKCQNMCILKLPNSYDCNKSTFNSKYKAELNMCYETCFVNNYKCNSVALNSGPKSINYGDLGLGLAFLIIFCLCISRYTCCENVEFKRTKAYSSSTVHVEEIVVKENNV